MLTSCWDRQRTYCTEVSEVADFPSEAPLICEGNTIVPNRPTSPLRGWFTGICRGEQDGSHVRITPQQIIETRCNIIIMQCMYNVLDYNLG